MKAINFDEFGPASVLKLSEAPDPILRPNDLLVRTRAAGVNRADLTHRRGGYGRPDFGDSTIMGLEIAGDVIAVGENVRGYRVGDRVMGIVGGGAYAEIARIDYRMAMPIPEKMDYIHAAAITEVFVTANEALINLGQLQAGETVLVHAGAGGVGGAAVQLAHAVGATVLTTAKKKRMAWSTNWAQTTPLIMRTKTSPMLLPVSLKVKGWI
ncbi:alcohol dehydrogenase catalytic domain-containing protein [Mangrovibacter sp. SLW1]